MKSMLKDAAILFAITVASGFILGAVYHVTAAPIAAAEAQAQKEAFQECFPEMSEVAALEESMQRGNEYLASNGIEGAEFTNEVMCAKDTSANTIGYIFTVTSHEGYGGDITFTLGIQLDGTVTGVSLLAISETPGLGMKAEEVLVPQFKGKQTEQISYTKTGATAEDQIDAISGATITTKAMTNAVNAGLSYFTQVVREGGNN